MTERDANLERIATALERLVPVQAVSADWHEFAAYVWDGKAARGVSELEAPALGLLHGIEQQKAQVTANIERMAQGHAAHDMLLWGSRGMGKSALVRASVIEAQAADPTRLALVQVAPDALGSLSGLFAQLANVDRIFLVFIDDLGFDGGHDDDARRLRSWLDGGVEARPANVRLAITSNRRAIVERHTSEQDDPINPRDAVDDKLALADRFGLAIGFHNCSQDDYLAIVGGYAEHYGLAWEASDALEWSKRRGARSGRTAWQFITELAGRAGKAL